MADWHWDPNVGRYRDLITGRFVARDNVLNMIGQSISATSNVTDALGSFVATGAVNVADWQASFWLEIKAEYIRQYLSGVGGRQMMTPADWGSIGGMLKEQLGYLKDFAKDVLSGNLSEGQIKARMAMYVNSAREAHERARSRGAKKLGMDEVAWVLDGPIAHCDTCVERSLMGWQETGPNGGFPSIDGEVWPADGSALCLTNDKCSLAYRNSKTNEEWGG